MTPEQRAALREAAKKATPGPWFMEPDETSPDILAAPGVVARTVASDMPRQVDALNAAFIAAANPAAVLALLDENARMREALKTIANADDHVASCDLRVVARHHLGPRA